MADQRNQRNVLRPSEALVGQHKRLWANKVSVCRNEGLKSQTLHGQVFRGVWEDQFHRFEKNGSSGESGARNFSQDRFVAFR
jgi:hypothetical protein